MFRHYRVILRQPVTNTLPSYTSISIPVPCIFCYFVLWPTNAQSFHKLSHCYMFRHYRVILRQPAINTLPVTPVFQMQLSVIQFTIKMFRYGNPSHGSKNAKTHYVPASTTVASSSWELYRGADKSLVRRGRKQAWKYVTRRMRFQQHRTRAVIKFFFLQDKAPKEIHAILTETLSCFFPGRAKDLSVRL